MSRKTMPMLVLLLIASQALSVAAEPLDTLIRERVMTSPPDRPKAQVYDNGAVMIGDLFKSRARIAIAVSAQKNNLLEMACFVHRAGDWQEIARQTLGTDANPFRFSDEWPMTLTDLDGDNAPELLITEMGGGDERLVSVWRYHAEQQALTHVGSGLRNPQWTDGQVRSAWKLGFTRGDVGAEEHAWVDGRLVRTWSSEQRYSLHEYLIGSGEPAVRVEQTVRSSAGADVITSVTGNVASYRNHLPAGEQPRTMTLLLQEQRGRTHVHIAPQEEALRSANLSNKWDELISRAVLADPQSFSSTMSVKMSDGKDVPLNSVANVTVTPTTTGTTYQFFSLTDEQRAAISEPPILPALAITNLDIINWTRLDQSVPAWAAAAATSAPSVKNNDDTLLFIRLPNFTGYPLDQIEIGTMVTSLTITDRVVNVLVSVTPGERPRVAVKDVPRPLLVLNLGRLSAGKHVVNATISGLPEPHPGKVSMPFTVE